MANLTTNTDIDYIQKDFTSTVDALVAYANINYGPGTSANRLWTDFNTDSFSRTWLEIVAYVADVLFFYLDNQATQSYLQTASIRSSVELIAQQFGFVPATATSASGIATFTVTGPVTIPRGFRVQASNGEVFYVTNPVTAVAAGTINANVIQGEIITEQFVAVGLQNEEFDLRSQLIIRDRDNINPADISPQLTVNGNEYTLVSTLIRNNGTDQPAVEDSLGNVIGGGGRVFLLGTRANDTNFITFGDGIFGRKLQPGENVSITYRSGGGTAGNIAQGSLTTLLSSLPQVTAVTNVAEFSGGSDEQSIEQLRQLIPASLRTLERAVAEQDYSDLLIANFSEVFTASTEANLEDPGIDLNIYVVPQGTGITNISNNILLRNKLSNFIDRRKMVTIQFQIADAFGIDTLFTFEIFISDTASKSTVSTSVKSAIADFFNLRSGGSDGAGIKFAHPILIKDITNVIETIPGIVRFEIKKLTYRPRVDKNIVGLLTEYQNSDVTVYPTVQEREWLLAAAGPQSETAGVLLFSNTGLIGFTYNSSTGLLQYAFPVELEGVAPGDQFRDGSGTDFTILGVNIPNNNLYLSTGLTINNTVSTANHGSIRNGTTSYESFKCFKKTRASATNLSTDSITDSNLDLSVLSGVGSAISARVLLDNTNVFIQNQYATGDFYLVDAASNIWEIVSNDSNTIKTAISAVNDASVVTVASGNYKIVANLTGQQVLFQNSIFNIQYNSDNTLYSIGGQFNQIGTIGDAFAISVLQSKIGSLGVNLDLVAYSGITNEIRLNSSPDLAGISSDYVLIDSAGQIFNLVGVDNTTKPSVFYDSINKDGQHLLEGSGLSSVLAQGFKVSTTDIYAIVSLHLKREGNIVGNLTAKIVNDDGAGLPDLSSIVATSQLVNVSSIPNTAFSKILFNFTTPPVLTAGTQYHLVLSSDAAYASSEQSAVASFSNTGLVGFTYNSISGVITYSAPVNLSAVLPGHYFSDSIGNLFQILAVSDSTDEITIATGQTVNNTTPTLASHGSAIIYDRVLLGKDSSSPTYTDGEFSRYNGVSWSNSTLGPSPSGSTEDLIFSVEGTKTLTIDSNLVPVMGPGATVSTRYYDDENQISLILGISNSVITSASDVNALGKGTVAAVPNRSVDTFVFRTSRYSDDIVNLRLNEIPEVQDSDININIFGGID